MADGDRTFSPPAEGRQTRDVMAFGQEIGRVLSDGRIVGRAEPFAKVFPSSRAVKRAVGLIAWGILEDIALDARLDERGRLVADTKVRRIAANLGLSKTTVHKHLTTLRASGFVFHEELREADSGRYEQVRYVIDPSACIERFTVAPGTKSRPSGDGTNSPSRPPPGPAEARVPDSGTRSVYQNAVHGDLVQNRRQEAVEDPRQQPRASDAAGVDEAGDGELVAGLVAAGVAGSIARQLVQEQPPERIRDALEAVGGKRLHNPAGWLVRAVSGTWDLSADIEEARNARARQAARQLDEAAAARRPAQEAQRRERESAWEAAICAAFDDAQLAEAIKRLTTPVPGLGRRSVPAACAALGPVSVFV